jgi:alpha-D-xyloside xylohydrolase
VDDAVIDLSNPEAERWYKGKLARLLGMGVSVFTADFGEAAPLSGLYASGQASFLEHNLYPLRYNKAVSEATEEVSGHGTIYARSAWAGSQRYPIHWSGDAETTDAAMAATLRAGLSLGLCGFSFWSHFIGGFPYPSPPELYLRWLAFGVLTSHSRCHGMPPTEPWEYGEEFTKEFRRIVEMRYRLMPYVYAQARLCSERGYPMLRTLFFEYPEDPACWTVEDEYMFGRDLLVAPLMEETRSRNVYLPPENLGRLPAWQNLRRRQMAPHHRRGDPCGGACPARRGDSTCRPCSEHRPHRLVRDRVGRLQGRGSAAEGLVCLPEDGELHHVRLKHDSDGFALEGDPLHGRVAFRIVHSA